MFCYCCYCYCSCDISLVLFCMADGILDMYVVTGVAKGGTRGPCPPVDRRVKNIKKRGKRKEKKEMFPSLNLIL